MTSSQAIATAKRPIKKWLRSMLPFEVSFVDKPANLKKFLVTKRAVPMGEARDEVLERIRQSDGVNEKIDALLQRVQVRKDATDMAPDLSAGAEAALRAIGRILAPYAEEIPSEVMMSLLGEVGITGPDGADAEDAEEALPQPDVSDRAGGPSVDIQKPDSVSSADHATALGLAQQAYTESSKAGGDQDMAQRAAMEAYIKQLSSAGYTVAKRATPSFEDTMPETTETEKKEQAPDTQPKPEVDKPAEQGDIDAKLEALKAENDKLAGQLATERDARIDRELVQKSQEFVGIAPPEQILAVLKSAHGNAEQEKHLLAILKSAHEQVKTATAQGGDLYGEVGSKLADNRPAKGVDRIQELANQIVSKSADKIDPNKAYVIALKSDEGRKIYREDQKAKGF